MTAFHPPLICALQRPECYPHPVSAVRLIETHISWVLLTGAWTYKLKKPINAGFLDFSTLESRRHFCNEELRLNQRLAPRIYDSVVEIRGAPDQPRIGGTGPVLEYAVRMREFPQDALASTLLARGALTTHHVDLLAQHIAAFHAAAARAADNAPFGTPASIAKPALQNFEQLAPCLDDAPERNALQALRAWTGRTYRNLESTLASRKRDGCVRECHGDLHMRNIAVLEERPVAFDCIEFDDALRWIDVMSEIAFVVMDFEDFERGDLAYRFLNGYLEASGDYAGLDILRFYLVYRALVRAKIHALRARQPGIAAGESRRLGEAVRQYIALAQRYTCPPAPGLIITHGVSGSGKTSATQALLESSGAIRLRSDIERKRLHGVSPLARTHAAPGAGIYAHATTTATYDRLLQLARRVVSAGYRVIVDAAFLRRGERDAFRAAARELGVPFRILALDAPATILRERVMHRLERGHDASEADAAVLERQLGVRDLPADDETDIVRIDTSHAVPRPTWDELFACAEAVH
ncbi:MAG: bifunctional aminoglycoside phosphotransferase/ATP-binding protein [Betaproteobacteria bacterium]